MQTKEKLKISVVIPTHNRKAILRKALEAYKKQTLPQEQIEILVIDDGSTDGSKDVVEKLRKAQPNIRYLRHQHGGPAKARNLGIEKATSELILFTGDDCIPDPALLEAHLKRHANEKGIGVLGHISWHKDIEVTPFMTFIERDVQFNYSTIQKAKENVPFRYFYTSNISLPRRYLLDIGGFDENFKYAVWEDIELGYRLWKSAVRIVYEPHAKTFHHHKVSLEDYLQRQYHLGLMGALLYRKHPELCEIVPVKETVNPEIQYRFYHGLLDYYYFMGIQQGLKQEDELPASVKEIPVISLEERLENWNSLWLDKLHQRLRQASQRVKELEEVLRDKDFIIKAEKEEITRRDKTIDQTIIEKERIASELREEIAELCWFENRVKTSLAYKTYKFFKHLFR